MVLVDTSVFIGYLKGLADGPYLKMKHLVDHNLPYGICGYVYQELLQGAQSKKNFELLKNYLDPLPIFELKHGKQSYENAARVYFDCRRKGITVRSIVDLVIAEIAIENGLRLLHDDKDYCKIATVAKDLVFY